MLDRLLIRLISVIVLFFKNPSDLVDEEFDNGEVVLEGSLMDEGVSLLVPDFGDV